MAFPDLVLVLKKTMPDLRGRVLANQPLAELTWFRVGGPAQLLFMPEDEADLSYFLAHFPAEFAVTVIGLGSNLIVRDGGVPGAVVRLGRGFNGIGVEDTGIRAGAAVPDVKIARAAHDAGIAGLSFMRGIPGAIGGALRMNGGAYGRETKDALVEARESTQPVKSRTGGSTFKNPSGHKAWQLIDAAGCRGLMNGNAQVSEMHCNFLINRGGATAAEIEALGELVRRKVEELSGVRLEWEIERIGIAA